MKLVLRIVLVIVIVDLGIGFYLLSQEHPSGQFVTGLGVLAFALILLPLFLYSRYRGKNIKDYTLDSKKMDQIIENLKN